MDRKVYEQIRKTWEIDASTKAHGEKKSSQEFQRRQNRQKLNNMVGFVDADELEELEEDME